MESDHAQFVQKRKQVQATWHKDQEQADHVLNEDVEAAFAEQDANDAKEEAASIKYTPLGGEECPVNDDDEEIMYCSLFRIPKLENLDKCSQLKVSDSQYLTKMVGPSLAQELD